ncbi:MAG: hypothetical protein JNK66_12485 [Chitinophagales bacterium]|nr:hypothetical protein [Chitinophagales bacterium]
MKEAQYFNNALHPPFRQTAVGSCGSVFLSNEWLSCRVEGLTCLAVVVGLSGGEKKLKMCGGENFSWGGNKKLSLASFALCVCLVRLARVCFLCAVAYFISAGVRFLFAGGNFLFAAERFLFVGIGFLSSVLSFLIEGSGIVKAVNKSHFSGGGR